MFARKLLLYKNLHILETGFLVEMWRIILGRFNKTSLTLQRSSVDMNNAVSLLSSLVEFVDSLRFKFDEFETVGKHLSANGI